MGFFDWIKLIFGTEQFNAHINALKAINEEYRFKLDQQEKIIRELEQLRIESKTEDPEDTNVRYEREKDAHMQLIECNKDKRDLQEKIIFLEYEIKKLKSK